MATLTDPMTLLLPGPWSRVRGPPAVRCCLRTGRWTPSHSSGGRRCPAGRVRSARLAAFGVDQLGEPADLPVHRLQAVALELERVAVEPLAGAGQRRAQALSLLLDGPAAAFEDP